MFYLILTVATLQRVKVQNDFMASAGPVAMASHVVIDFYCVFFSVSVNKFTQLYSEESKSSPKQCT